MIVKNIWWEENDLMVEFEDGTVSQYTDAYISSISHGLRQPEDIVEEEQ